MTVLHTLGAGPQGPLEQSLSLLAVGWEENRTYFTVGIKEGPAGNLLSRAHAEQVLAKC